MREVRYTRRSGFNLQPYAELPGRQKDMLQVCSQAVDRVEIQKENSCFVRHVTRFSRFGPSSLSCGAAWQCSSQCEKQRYDSLSFNAPEATQAPAGHLITPRIVAFN